VEGKPYDLVSRISFSPDGTRVAYGAKDGKAHWLVIGDSTRPIGYLPNQVVYSADGGRVAYWTLETDRRGRERVVVNEVRGPTFDAAGWPTFDDSATIAAYWARAGRGYVMVAGDRKSRTFDGVGTTRVFSEDGSEVGFGVLDGRELRWTVMKTR
jgi:hypothetical protein